MKRIFLFSLVALSLAPASASACIGSRSDIADDLSRDLSEIDKALVTANISSDLRGDLVKQRAEAGRLSQEGAALRKKAADENKEPALSGIKKQFAADEMAHSMMKVLSIPIWVHPKSLGEPGCGAAPVIRRFPPGDARGR